MPTVIINDVPCESQIGERLLDVARRNGAHIGFLCDGKGVCQTCQFRVLSGGQHLNPPKDAEKAWLPADRLQRGHRLACQSAVRGPGPVSILTGVEELRRQTIALLDFNSDRDLADRMAPLLENVMRAGIDQLRLYPSNLLSSLARVGLLGFFWPWDDFGRWLNDAARITSRMTGDATTRLPADQSSATPGANRTGSE